MSVPALRFQEFSGDWEETILSKVTDSNIKWSLTGGPFGSNLKAEDYTESGIRIIQLQNIGDGIFNDEYKIYTSTNKADELLSCNIYPSEIIISKMGDPVARCCIMPASQERYLMASDGIRLVVNKVKFSVRFTHYLINHSTFRRNAIEVSTGTTRRRIGLSELKNLPVIYPSLLEQTKIANFLTAVDEKITLLTQKADLLSQYKKGVMQQIFSQELRFKDDDGQEFPEWEEKTLGDVADITTGNSNRIDSTIGDGAYTFFDRSQDIRTSDIYLFDCEAVIVAGEGQEFIPKHFIGKFDLHQRTYAIIKFKSASGKYLFYYIHNFRYYFLSQAVGSTVKSLRLPMFQQMPIQLPSLPEQTKIANFLTAIDEKITNNQNQLNAVKQYKQGLLQQMFV
jgi:type I restriction enzyme S subunit